jgi:hypothetical protein
MKKLYLFLSLSIFLFGCSSIELEAVPSSNDETQRILAMGLSHEESLAEAKKLDSQHMVNVVTLQLTNAHDEKIQAKIDLAESMKFASMVTISDDGLIFSSAELSESVSGVLETDANIIKYTIQGIKDLNSGLIDHKIQLSLSHNSKNKRSYLSYSICDEWNNCEDRNNEIEVGSVIASNCTNSSCNFNESIQINMSDNLLRSFSSKGLFMLLKSKRKAHKINISYVYLRGYLEVAK